MRREIKTELIPTDWSADQAYTVYEFLRELTEIVWERYRGDIVRSIQPHCSLDCRKWRDDEQDNPENIPW